MEWNRIIDLVKKTGERCVVIDPDHDEPVVIMSLGDYEFLAEHHAGSEEFDFGFEDDVSAGIPFEPDVQEAVPEWEMATDNEEPPILETLEEIPVTDVEEMVAEETWYIEPIGEDL